VDLVGELAATTPIQVLEALAAWEGCDAVIHLGVVGRLHLVCSMLQAVRASGQAIDPAYAEQGLAMYRQAEQDFFACAAKFMERYRKPILGVFLDDRKSRTLTDIPGSPYKRRCLPHPGAGCEGPGQHGDLLRMAQGPRG
jgi:hypothetical protein